MSTETGKSQDKTPGKKSAGASVLYGGPDCSEGILSLISDKHFQALWLYPDKAKSLS
jgi:hypothetical protein